MITLQKKLALLAMERDSFENSILQYNYTHNFRHFPSSQYTKLSHFLQEVSVFSTTPLIQTFINDYSLALKQNENAMPEDYLGLLRANVRFRSKNHELMAFSLGELWRKRQFLQPEDQVQVIELLSEAGIQIDEFSSFVLENVFKSPQSYLSFAPEIAYYVGRLGTGLGLHQLNHYFNPQFFLNREKVAMWGAGILMTRGFIDLIQLQKIYNRLNPSYNLTLPELIFMQIMNPDGKITEKMTLESLFLISKKDQMRLKKQFSGWNYEEMGGIGTSIGPYYFPEKRRFVWPTSELSRSYMSETLRGDYRFYKESLLKAGFDVVEKPVAEIVEMEKSELRSLIFE